MAESKGVDSVSEPVAEGPPGVLVQATLEPGTVFDRSLRSGRTDPRSGSIRRAEHPGRRPHRGRIRRSRRGRLGLDRDPADHPRRRPPDPDAAAAGGGRAADPDRDRDPQLPGLARSRLLRLRRDLRLPGVRPLAAAIRLRLPGRAWRRLQHLPDLRAREETIKHGSEQGILRALAVTGGGHHQRRDRPRRHLLVLAVLPLTFLTELGFVVAFGVLLDTFLVRSILVPAIALDLGDTFWWPSYLSRPRSGTSQPAEEREPAPT